MDFHVLSFWLEIAILGQILTFFLGGGVNRVKCFKNKHFNLKKTHPCVIQLILSNDASKSVPKKIKSQESDISPICPEVPRERIFTKLGTNVPLMDLINCDKLCDNLFKGLNFTGGQSSNFSHMNLTSPL